MLARPPRLVLPGRTPQGPRFACLFVCLCLRLPVCLWWHCYRRGDCPRARPRVYQGCGWHWPSDRSPAELMSMRVAGMLCITEMGTKKQTHYLFWRGGGRQTLNPKSAQLGPATQGNPPPPCAHPGSVWRKARVHNRGWIKKKHCDWARVPTSNLLSWERRSAGVAARTGPPHPPPQEPLH